FPARPGKRRVSPGVRRAATPKAALPLRTRRNLWGKEPVPARAQNWGGSRAAARRGTRRPKPRRSERRLARVFRERVDDSLREWGAGPIFRHGGEVGAAGEEP